MPRYQSLDISRRGKFRLVCSGLATIVHDRSRARAVLMPSKSSAEPKNKCSGWRTTVLSTVRLNHTISWLTFVGILPRDEYPERLGGCGLRDGGVTSLDCAAALGAERWRRSLWNVRYLRGGQAGIRNPSRERMPVAFMSTRPRTPGFSHRPGWHS